MKAAKKGANASGRRKKGRCQKDGELRPCESKLRRPPAVKKQPAKTARARKVAKQGPGQGRRHPGTREGRRKRLSSKRSPSRQSAVREEGLARLFARHRSGRAATPTTSAFSPSTCIARSRANQLSRTGQGVKAEAEALIEEMEPGDIQFDEESGEGGTVTVDRERDLALSAQALAAVEEIDDALTKIKTGRYGVCEGCGGLIPKAPPRGVAVRAALYCVQERRTFAPLSACVRCDASTATRRACDVHCHRDRDHRG